MSADHHNQNNAPSPSISRSTPFTMPIDKGKRRETIENVWAMLKKRTKKGFRKRSPQNQREVVEAAQEEWEKLDMIDGMLRRVEAVINAEGERAKY